MVRKKLFDALLGEEGVFTKDDFTYMRVQEVVSQLNAIIEEVVDDADVGYLLSMAIGDIEIGQDMLNHDTAGMIVDLRSLGVAIEDIELAALNSDNVSEFTEKLKSLKEEAAGTSSEVEEVPKTVDDYVKEIAKMESEISTVEKLLKSIEDGDAITFDDLWGLKDSHPELLFLIGDVKALESALKDLKTADELSKAQSFTRWLLNSEDVAKNSPFSEAFTGAEGAVTTLQELRNIAMDNNNPDLLMSIDDWLQRITQDAMDAGKEIERISGRLTDFGTAQETANTMSKIQSLVAQLDPTNKNYSAASAMAARAALEELVPGLAGMDIYGAQGQYGGHVNYTNEMYIAVAKQYLEDLQKQIDATAQEYDVMTDAEAEAARKAAEAAEEMEKAMKQLRESVQAAREELEAGRAGQFGFGEQINTLMDALQNGDVVSAWTSMSKSMQSGIEKTYPQLVQAIRAVEVATGDASEEQAELSKQLANAKWQASIRTFTETATAIKGLGNYTVTATDAYAKFYSEAEKAVKAQDEYEKATQKSAEGTEVIADDVKELASFLGYVTPDALLQDWDQVGPRLSQALAEGEDALNRLNEAAFINITGTSSVDFSNLMNGLVTVQDVADETVQKLLATGQFQIETRDLKQEMDVWEWAGLFNGGFVKKTALGQAQFLVPTGNNPLKGKSSTPTANTGKKSGGGGGGGGGGGNKNSMTEVERMIDRQNQIQAIQGHTKNLYSAQASYYGQTGELQGVIKYTEKEIDALKRQNETLRANIDELEPWLDKKKAEIAALKTTDSAYEEVSDDLKKLQDQHQKYTIELINNQAEVDKLTKAIKEQRDTIRSMQIDLRNLVLQAIKDREELNNRMLQGTIQTENTILDLIQKRYEKERDLILDNANKQIEALQKERDLLDEQLQLRKEQAEEEDKATKLAELEAKYARISADPTRRKEALEIQRDINDLRKEMAWDVAEKEVKAQQDSIDQQISSIEDYKAEVESYYEDLFKHPQKLIEEMRTIIMQTDEEIVEWLKQNSEDYADKTEATQTDMVNKWKSMLSDMRGELELYWDEVESIIAQGDDAIIQFLKDNTASYREAGKLQAEAYVDEWTKKIDDLRLALQIVNGDAEPADYQYIAPNEGDGKGGSGGTSGGGATASSSTTNAGTSAGGNKKWHVHGTDPMGRKQIFGPTYETEAEAEAAVIKATRLGWTDPYISAYAKGGLAKRTGLAWLDGSPSDPERLLSPYQTSLFESLVESLTTMARVSAGDMPFFGNNVGGAAGAYNVGDITVNVDKLETDEDYEEIANHVFAAIMNRLNRGSVVGGIRLV